MFYLLHPAMPDRYGGLTDEIAEFKAIHGEYQTGSNLAEIPAGSIVIPRYRMLPFGRELEQEVASLGSRLINTFRQHRHIADLMNWVPLLEGLTAPVYQQHEVPYLPEGEWFVKGETNSIKNRWFECCYAPTTKDLPTVVRNNMLDVYVGSQPIYIRPFQHYRQVATAVDGRPVFNERRVFVYEGKVISEGNYWVSQMEEEVSPLDESKMWATINEAVDRTSDLADFYVIDVAEYPDGTWSVVELNDGSMSGLSANDPHTVWSGMKK